jgi:hypothetical protein
MVAPDLYETESQLVLRKILDRSIPVEQILATAAVAQVWATLAVAHETRALREEIRILVEAAE